MNALARRIKARAWPFAVTACVAAAGADDRLGATSPIDAPVEAAPEMSRLRLAAGVLVGVVEAPYVVPEFPTVSAHVVLLRLAAIYRLTDAWALGVVLPHTWFSVRQPAGAYVDQAAWGNPTVSATYSIPPSFFHGKHLQAWVRLRLGIPLARHGASGSTLQGRGLHAAYALDAHRAVESFAGGVLPVVPGLGLRLHGGRYRVAGALEMPLLVRVSDADLPSEVEARGLGWSGRLQLQAGIDLASWIGARLATDTVVAFLSPVPTAHGVSPLQWSVNPALLVNFGWRVAAEVGLVIPIGGALGGSVYSGGVTLRSSW